MTKISSTAIDDKIAHHILKISFVLGSCQVVKDYWKKVVEGNEENVFCNFLRDAYIYKSSEYEGIYSCNILSYHQFC